MKKKSASVQFDLAEARNSILQSLPDPKANNTSTIIDEFFVKGRKIAYSAQKSKGSEGFYWNISIS